MATSGVNANTLRLIRRNIYGPGGEDIQYGGGVASDNATTSAVTGNVNSLGLALGLANAALGIATANPISLAMAIGNISQAVQGKQSLTQQALSGIVGAVTGSTGGTSSGSSPNGTATAGVAEGFSADGQSLGPVGAADGSGVGGDSGSSGDSGSTGSPGGDSGTAGAGVGTSDGGGWFKGGKIPGSPAQGIDKVNINVTGGEYVIPNHVVEALGTNFFDKLLEENDPKAKLMAALEGK